MIKTNKYRLYPNKTQEQELRHWLRVVCDVYCILVDYKSRLWETTGRHAKEKDLREMFKLVRQHEEEIWDIPQAIFTVLIRFRIMTAYRSFFALIKKFKDEKSNLTGRPHTIDIKSHNNWAIIKRNRYESGDRRYAKDLPKRVFDSIQFGADKNNRHAWIEKDRLYLSKFRFGGIKIRVHRPIDGDLRFIVLKKEYNKWYACCSIACEAKRVEVPKLKRDVGIDLGITSLVTTSNGKHYAGIEAYKKAADKLSYLCQKRSGKQYGSKSNRKVNREIGKVWEKIRNIRKTIIDQTVHELVNNYDIIYHEDIDIRSLLSRNDSSGRRKMINKRLTDQIWGTFLKRMGEKIATLPGKQMIPIPAHYTSQMCSRCYRIKSMPLSSRIYRCPHCGLIMDRDVNAAINILNFGRGEFGAWIAADRWKKRHPEIAAD
jgi:transposase